ncbi:MAG TPA: hypothetical protein VNU45_18075 [Rummeliibacillus sp.]|nr:hypothetical protein [Rummeliibacillus sp.]
MKEKTKKSDIKNVGGRPTTLTEEISKAIIDDVRASLSINYAAEANDQPRATIWSWIDHGRIDREAGKSTIFSKFSAGIKRARADYVHEAIQDVRAGKPGWQGTAWLLERCCAEDFGKDSELYKQLLEDYKMLMQSLIDQNKGVNHG